jgi:hypothetical protein
LNLVTREARWVSASKLLTSTRGRLTETIALSIPASRCKNAEDAAPSVNSAYRATRPRCLAEVAGLGMPDLGESLSVLSGRNPWW